MAWRWLHHGILFLTVGFWLAGCSKCATTDCLDDPDLPASKTASIQGYVPLLHGTPFGEIVKIEYIDGKLHSALKYGNEARVLPGIHSIQLYNCSSWGPVLFADRTCLQEYRTLITFNLKAGHSYDAFSDGGGQFWIVDADSGAVVVGETPPVDVAALGLPPEPEPGDDTARLEQFLPLANQGNAIAQNILGRLYVTGEVVAQDYTEAVKWFRLAAEQGHRGAMKTLSFLYWGGEGVARDYVEAYMWYSLAATLGNEATRDARDVIAGAMSPAQIAEAERLAREWLASHGE